MFVPDDYTVDEATARTWLTRPGLAEVVVHGSRLMASALPMVHRAGEGYGSLVFHVDRRNPLWTEHDGRALAIIRGPEGYISPTWRPGRGDKALPTWDFQRLHASGSLVIHDDVDWVREHLRELIATYEPSTWRLDDASTEHVERLLPEIVGMELVVDELLAEAKLGQERDEADTARIVAELRADGNTALARDVAQGCPHVK